MYQRTALLLLTGCVSSFYCSLPVSRSRWAEGNSNRLLSNSPGEVTLNTLQSSTDSQNELKQRSCPGTEGNIDFISLNPQSDEEKIVEVTPIAEKIETAAKRTFWSFMRNSWSDTDRRIKTQSFVSNGDSKSSGQGNTNSNSKATLLEEKTALEKLRAFKKHSKLHGLKPIILEEKKKQHKNIKEFSEVFDATTNISQRVRMIEDALRVLHERPSDDITPEEGLIWIQIFSAIMDVGDEKIASVPLESAVQFGLIDLETKFSHEWEINIRKLKDSMEQINCKNKEMRQTGKREQDPKLHFAHHHMQSDEKELKGLIGKTRGYERLYIATQNLQEFLDLRFQVYMRNEAIKAQVRTIPWANELFYPWKQFSISENLKKYESWFLEDELIKGQFQLLQKRCQSNVITVQNIITNLVEISAKNNTSTTAKQKAAAIVLLAYTRDHFKVEESSLFISKDDSQLAGLLIDKMEKRCNWLHPLEKGNTENIRITDLFLC